MLIQFTMYRIILYAVVAVENIMFYRINVSDTLLLHVSLYGYI